MGPVALTPDRYPARCPFVPDWPRALADRGTIVTRRFQAAALLCAHRTRVARHRAGRVHLASTTNVHAQYFGVRVVAATFATTPSTTPSTMQRLPIRPEHPDPRALRLAAEAVMRGKLVILPTDSVYTIAGAALDPNAATAIWAVRQLPKSHPLTLLCPDISCVAKYALLPDATFRLIRRLTPGPYTFILEASRAVPKKLQMKRKQVGVRVVDHPVVSGLLALLDGPLICASASEDGEVLFDPDELARTYHEAEVFIDAGVGGRLPTTVLDCTELPPEVLRQGLGPMD